MQHNSIELFKLVNEMRSFQLLAESAKSLTLKIRLFFSGEPVHGRKSMT